MSLFGVVVPERVFGVASLPADLAFLDSPQPPEELPFDAFVRINIKDKDETDNLACMLKIGYEDKEVEGKKHAVVGAGLLFHRPDTTSVEFGVEDYITASGRRFFTPRLYRAFAATPEVSIRIAMDLETQKESVSAIVDQQIKQLDDLDPATQALSDEPEPARNFISSPARNGIRSCSPNENDLGTFHGSRCNVICVLFRGSP